MEKQELNLLSCLKSFVNCLKLWISDSNPEMNKTNEVTPTTACSYFLESSQTTLQQGRRIQTTQ